MVGSFRHTAWSAVLLLAVMMFGGTLMRAVFGPLQEAAKLDMGLSDFRMFFETSQHHHSKALPLFNCRSAPEHAIL